MATQKLPPHTVEVSVDTMGKINFEVRGIKGGGCTNIADVIRKATGLRVVASKPTGEAFEAGVHCSVGPAQTVWIRK